MTNTLVTAEVRACLSQIRESTTGCLFFSQHSLHLTNHHGQWREILCFFSFSLAFWGGGGNKELNCNGKEMPWGGHWRETILGESQGWQGRADLRANFSWPREVNLGNGRPWVVLVLNWPIIPLLLTLSPKLKSWTHDSEFLERQSHTKAVLRTEDSFPVLHWLEGHACPILRILITEKPESLPAHPRTLSSLELTMMLISHWSKKDINNSSPGLLKVL